MPKFKVGDKVKFVQKSQNYMDFPIGTEATIIQISNGDMLWWECIVQLESEAAQKWGWSLKKDGKETIGCQYAVFRDLELVEEKKFKLNDRVVYNGGMDYISAVVPKGSIGTIVVEDGTSMPRVRFDNDYELWVDVKLLSPYKEEKKSIYKFKIGDRVRCVCENQWVPVGTTGTVDELSTNPFVKWDNGERWCLYQNQMVLLSDFNKDGKINIAIYRQGNSIIAKLFFDKKVYAEAEAKCNPDDFFSWAIGSQIALQRLMEKAIKNKTIVLPKDTKMSDLFTY